MRSKAEIQAEIDEFSALLKDDSVPKDEKDFATQTIAELKAELAEAEKGAAAKAEGGKKPESDSGKKRGRPAKPEGEKKKRVRKPSKPKAKDENEPSCEELLKKFHDRREQAKKSQRRSRTQSVFAKVADRVESAVNAAIKSVAASDIKENPKKYIKLIEDLQDNMEKFLQSMKGILGDEYDAQEWKDASKHIRDLVDKLKKKYEGK